MEEMARDAAHGQQLPLLFKGAAVMLLLMDGDRPFLGVLCSNRQGLQAGLLLALCAPS